MPTSDKDLQSQQAKVAKLREQAAQAQRDREEKERELANDSTMAALKAEEESLTAQIEAHKTAAKEVQHRNRYVLDPAAAQAEEDAARKEALENAKPEEAAVASGAATAAKEK